MAYGFAISSLLRGLGTAGTRRGAALAMAGNSANVATKILMSRNLTVGATGVYIAATADQIWSDDPLLEEETYEVLSDMINYMFLGQLSVGTMTVARKMALMAAPIKWAVQNLPRLKGLSTMVVARGAASSAAVRAASAAAMRNGSAALSKVSWPKVYDKATKTWIVYSKTSGRAILEFSERGFKVAKNSKLAKLGVAGGTAAALAAVFTDEPTEDTNQAVSDYLDFIVNIGFPEEADGDDEFIRSPVLKAKFSDFLTDGTFLKRKASAMLDVGYDSPAIQSLLAREFSAVISAFDEPHHFVVDDLAKMVEEGEKIEGISDADYRAAGGVSDEYDANNEAQYEDLSRTYESDGIASSLTRSIS